MAHTHNIRSACLADEAEPGFNGPESPKLGSLVTKKLILSVLGLPDGGRTGYAVRNRHAFLVKNYQRGVMPSVPLEHFKWSNPPYEPPAPKEPGDDDDSSEEEEEVLTLADLMVPELPHVVSDRLEELTVMHTQTCFSV